jgi:hypothetical protein
MQIGESRPRKGKKLVELRGRKRRKRVKGALIPSSTYTMGCKTRGDSEQTIQRPESDAKFIIFETRP